MPRRARSAPSYLVFDENRGAWDLRFRYIDSIGRVHWPRERSPYPQDLVRSRQWAPWRRAELVREIEAEILRVETERAAPVTLGQVLDAYAADCRERGTRWESSEEYRARAVRETLGEDTPALDLTAGRLAAWRTDIRESRSLSPRSCNAYVNIVRAALNLAVERGLLAASPLGRLRSLPEPLRQPPALSERQVGAILAACRVWQRWERRPREDGRRQYLPIVTRVLLGYFTAGRPEAIDGLRWREVNLRAGVIAYASKGHRVVCPLDPVLSAHLRDLYAARKPAPDDLVLIAPRTATAVVNWRPAWDRTLHLANRRLEPGDRIPAGTPLHVLRHSGITHLLVAGVPAQVVAQVAGTSLTILEKHYAHAMVGSLERELERTRQHPALAEIAALARGPNGSQNAAHPLRHDADAPSDEAQDPESIN
jgi:site-specific recombinase XerD